ncbi:hypothetical protein Q8F55_000553 [Vanrija albida]|uniref:Uncharacterized protein n=1 Tax=Vanrija albida TaxID=181172 RepID=A0ABR3QDS3_9TREE
MLTMLSPLPLLLLTLATTALAQQDDKAEQDQKDHKGKLELYAIVGVCGSLMLFILGFTIYQCNKVQTGTWQALLMDQGRIRQCCLA